jgi:hypothetical protein
MLIIKKEIGAKVKDLVERKDAISLDAYIIEILASIIKNLNSHLLYALKSKNKASIVISVKAAMDELTMLNEDVFFPLIGENPMNANGIILYLEKTLPGVLDFCPELRLESR